MDKTHEDSEDNQDRAPNIKEPNREHSEYANCVLSPGKQAGEGRADVFKKKKKKINFRTLK